MSSGAPSPNSPPSAVPPPSTISSPPPPVSASPPLASSPPPIPSTTSPPPPVSASPPLPSSPPPVPSTPSPPPVTQPNGDNDTPPPSTPSTPPPQSPPPTVPAVPPPVTLSPPPPQPPSIPPPLPTPSPPILPPPSPPLATPPVVSTSPPPPVASTSPPPPVLSPPPLTPTVGSPPPVSQPPPSSPPPPQAIPPSPPPPNGSPPTPTNNSPPPLPSTSPPPPLPSTSPPPPLPSTSPPPPLPSTSPPPPSAIPPQNSPPPPRRTPPSPNSPQIPSPPPSRNPPPRLPPPPSNQPTPPSPPLPPSTSPGTNTSSGGSPPLPTPIPGVPTGPTNNSANPSVPDTAGAPRINSSGRNTGSVVGIGVVVGFVVLSLIGVAVWCLKRQKKKVSGYNGGYVMPSPHSSQMSDASFLKVHTSSPQIRGASSNESIYSSPEPGGLNNSRSWFTYKELLEVTNGFSEQNILGEGGFGCVYKGCLADGREVAVKQLKVGGSQGEREFKAEVETISRVHHRHLVSLVGYCISDDHRLLVYDYVPNNTLYYHLHSEGRTIMNWATRMKVAAGAGRGIAYLHEDCHPRIIHRDIKSSNILLDNNFEALVADFGLAKLALDAYTHITTRVMGTFGYMAPEYASSGKLTEKSDVYSYGVVLLELITGRKPVDVSQPLGDESLVEWARPLLNKALDNQEFGELIDPTLENNYVAGEMFCMVEAAAACVRHSAGRRPRMGQVVRALDCSDHSADLINGMKPGQSGVYDSVQQSAEIRLFQRMAFGSQDYSSEIFSRGSYG